MQIDPRLRTLVALLFCLLAVVACVPAATPTPTPEPKGGGGEFRVVLAAEPSSLNPNLRSDDAAFNASQDFYNKLATLDADYRVIPDLAERWDTSADGLTYTFYLAKNVKWHDGQPFTSADVKWTFETIAREKGFSQELANRIAEIQTPDATTVVMRLKEPLASFIPSLAWYGTFILPKHIFEGSDWTKNPANEKPIGTGPFKFVEWVKGDHITAVANKDYFKRGPFLDQVTWRFPKTAPLGPDLIVKGEADYSQASPPRERVAELQKTPGVQVKTFASTNRYFIGINVRRKPLDDLRVRQAINLAVDRSAVLSRAFAGLGTPGVGMYTPGIPWAYNPNAQAPAYDPTALTGYSSAEFDAAIAEGGSKSKVEDRAKVYFRAQEILARDLPLAPLVDPAFIVLARDNVTGLGYMEARGLVTFQDYSLVRVKR